MSVAETWEKLMRKTKKRFAMIRTDRAVYDRVAIVTDLPTLLTVQFIQGDGKRSRDNSSTLPRSKTFSVKQENISKRDIVRTRYYKD